MSDPLISAWLKAEKDAKEAADRARHAMEAAVEGASLPSNLRPAIANDIVEGAILWYLKSDSGHPYWAHVEDVIRPSDPWKAYTDTLTGCRYGLEGAYVEIG